MVMAGEYDIKQCSKLHDTLLNMKVNTVDKSAVLKLQPKKSRLDTLYRMERFKVLQCSLFADQKTTLWLSNTLNTQT